MDTLGIEPRASRMLSGCDTTTPRALESSQHSPGSLIFAKRGCGQGQRQTPCALLSSVQAGESLQPDTLGHVAWSAFFAAAGIPGLLPTMGSPEASLVTQAQRDEVQLWPNGKVEWLEWTRWGLNPGPPAC